MANESLPLFIPSIQVCTVPDCSRPVKCRGFCGPHYTKWRSALAYLPCGQDGCDKPPIKGSRRCGRHRPNYYRSRDRKCSVEECNSYAYGAYCQKHRLRLWRHGDVNYTTKTRIPADNLKERLYAQVEKTRSCWIWKGSVKNGYGRLTFKGRFWYTHQLSWYLHHGVESQLFVCHTCDNRRCVRPSHLFEGTAKDNVRDMIAKGRAPWQQADWKAFGRNK